MEISNLTFDQVKEKLKNYTYMDLLDLCKTLGVQVTELKNGIEMQRSYSKCIESILDYRENLELEKLEDEESEDENTYTNLEQSFALTIPIKFNLIQANSFFRYFILGNTDELGNWNLKNAIELTRTKNIHSCNIEIDIDNLENIEYKLIKKNNEKIYWEAGDNRKYLKDENYIIWR